jgi:hypothetical protein
VNAHGRKGFCRRYRRQDGGEATSQHPGEEPTLSGWTQFHLSSGSVNSHSVGLPERLFEVRLNIILP